QYVAGDHEAEALAHQPYLLRLKPAGYPIEREVDSGVEQEEILLLSSRPGGCRLQGIGQRLMEPRDAAQRRPREGYTQRIEVARIVGPAQSFQQISQAEENRGAGQQPDVEASRVAIQAV